MTGKQGRMGDLIGAVLLVLVAALYMSGVTQPPVEATDRAGTTMETWEVSHPVTPPAPLELRS